MRHAGLHWPGVVALTVGLRQALVCDRCKQSTVGKGYVAREWRPAAAETQADRQVPRHILCHSCYPTYEREEQRWQEEHPTEFREGMTREEKRAAIRAWGKAKHEHMGRWLSGAVQE